MITRSDCILFDMLGKIEDLFEREVDSRVAAEYPARREKKIFRNMLADPDAAMAYVRHVHDTKCAVKAEIEAHLGKSVDVGFDPSAATKALTDRVGELESTTGDLSEALTMILEGVVE